MKKGLHKSIVSNKKNRNKVILLVQRGSSLSGSRSLSGFSPQWGNRYILVWVNSPQTLSRYGADWARTANKSCPAVLKWRGCEWGGKEPWARVNEYRPHRSAYWSPLTHHPLLYFQAKCCSSTLLTCHTGRGLRAQGIHRGQETSSSKAR